MSMTQQERNAKYYAEHKEEIAAGKAKWYNTHKAELAEYRASHKAEKAAYMAGYNAAHKEEKNARQAKYCASHKVERADYYAGWREANKEAIAANDAEYYVIHKETIAAGQALWRTNNPKKVKARLDRYRARKMGAESDGSVLSDVMALFGPRCLCCGSELSLSVDHVVPLARGGSDLLDNKQPLCRSCNSSKGVKTVDYRITIRFEAL